VRDYAQVRGGGITNQSIARKALRILEVDEKGLDGMDRKILETVIYKFNGGPVGLKTLAMAVNEEPDTIEEVHEPYLVQEGFISRTPQGRKATKILWDYLGKKAPRDKQGELPL
jgi:Holliday junction DNA helicase RuvB